MIALHSVIKLGSYCVGHAFHMPELELKTSPPPRPHPRPTLHDTSPMTCEYEEMFSIRIYPLLLEISIGVLYD